MDNLNEFKDNMARSLFGRTRTESQEKRICVMCGKEAKQFKDVLSEKEYAISGICQICQDNIFG